MAKIDTTQIEGYAEMTAEQKIAALEKMDIPEKVDLTGYVKKSVFDAKASEAAAASRELKALKATNLTEEQKLQQAREEFEKEKLSFTKERNATKIKGIFGAAGLKEEAYAALPISDFTDETAALAFANSIVTMLSASQAAGEKAARQSLLGGDPPVSGGSVDTAASLKAEYADAVKKNDYARIASCMRRAQEKKITL